ncbi:MAG: DNA polymerase III subunit alpha, partial [Sphingomonadaceae bacterium]|nr:DNA polymerase III subunit alpha [Sphingomonadaceae bacterium]
DALDPDRARLHANIDLLLAVADAATRERESGQAGLFGGDDSAQDDLRLREAAEWPRLERMAKERDNFGFYFSAHPVQQHWQVASANGARTYQSLMEGGASGEGRTQAVMAAMVENARKGQTRKGKDFIRADFSDHTGQFSAACFEESLVESFTRWSEDATCVLLMVELDSPSPDEPPRITVRGARPLDEVRGTARMLLTLDVHDVGALQELRLALAPGQAGHGEVLVRLRTGAEEEPMLRLGRDFALDGDLAELLSAVPGVDNVSLGVRRGIGNLRLVA